jgi:hypothetical protein
MARYAVATVHARFTCTSFPFTHASAAVTKSPFCPFCLPASREQAAASNPAQRDRCEQDVLSRRPTDFALGCGAPGQRQQQGVDGASPLQGVGIDQDVGQGVQVGHRTPMAHLGSFETQRLRLTVDALGTGALRVDGLVDIPGIESRISGDVLGEAVQIGDRLQVPGHEIADIVLIEGLGELGQHDIAIDRVSRRGHPGAIAKEALLFSFVEPSGCSWLLLFLTPRRQSGSPAGIWLTLKGRGV